MAKADDLPADIRFEDAARRVLSSALRKMRDNAPATRAGLSRRTPTPQEIEALHDMRVGSRRLRAALAVFGSVFPKSEFRGFDEEIGRITDALGAVRDLDVQLDTLRQLQSTLPANEAYGIGRLIERQTRLRDKERKALILALDSLKDHGFARRFRTALDRATPEQGAGA
jgi:CHAD domain-containing protein